MSPVALPLTEDDLQRFLADREVPDENPFYGPDGAWVFDPHAGWPRHWYVQPRLSDWRELADPRYEGLEDPDLAQEALAAGRLPGHLVDDSDAVHELFKDGGGNVYLELEHVRTTDGHAPVFFFDHDKPWQITACARTLPELYARDLLTQDWSSLDDETRAVIDAPLPLEPSSLQPFKDELHDGWRAALGLPSRDEPPTRRAPERTVVTGATLQELDELTPLKEAYVQRFIIADAVDADALRDVLRPLSWWQVGTFTDLDAALRSVMARLLAEASQPVREDQADWEHSAQKEDLLAAAKLLDGLYQEGQLELAVYKTPEDVIREGCGAALERLTGSRWPDGIPEEDDGKRLLDSLPRMKAFQEGWRGIVPDEVLAWGDHRAYAVVFEHCTSLTLMKNTVYSMVRKCGDEHVDVLAQGLPSWLPADQVLVLHGLDNFPKHPGVLALYDQVLETTEHDFVRSSVTRYRDRVSRGIKPSGWET